MAGNRIDVNLSVNDQSGSLKKRNEEAKELNQNLTRAAQLAERAMKPAAARRQREAGENIEYGRGRGSMGATGAEARDFANQAQGLGGLVRLYATYAANLFAVTAAFNALRQAEATTMMVQGMDKLGAASGMALGGIAKQLVTVTDGTVSLREAMEATTKATAAGLSRDQLLDLGKVAKGASQALGVNMTDALSRLSRGVTKLEPELLDELGIFTKVGKAAEQYAKSVNKSVDSLTDFEKRQAFANAVIKEGKDKFGELAAQANPYDKLLASLSNVAQKILEIINSGLKPIVNLFAENTGLIAAAIALVAAKIFQQAIPSITSWRDNIAKAAKVSAQASQELNTTFGENVVGRLTKQFNVDQLDRDLKKATTSYDNAVKNFIASDNNYKRKSPILETLKSGQQLTSKQLATMQADVNKRMAEGSAENVRHAKSAQAIIDSQKEMIRLTKEHTKADTAFYGAAKFGSEEWQRQSITRQRLARAERLELLSGVGEKVEKQGFSAGLAAFKAEVDSSKTLGAWDKLKTKGVGTLVAISTAASIAMQAFGPLIWIVEAAVAVFMILDGIFSKNSAEVDAFNGAIDSLKESTKTATNVNDKFSNSLVTTQSLIARGTAITTLTDDINNLVQTLNQADKYASWWDRFLDGFKIPFGADLKTKFANSMDAGLTAAVKAVPEGPLKKELEDKLKKSLGTLDYKKAFEGLSKDDVIQKGEEVQKIVAETQKIVQKSRTLAENVKETNKATQESFLSFQNAVFKPTQLQTFILDTTKNITQLRDAFKDSIAAPAAFKDVLDGVTKLEYFDPETASGIMDLANRFKQLSKPIADQKTLLEETKQRLKEVEKQYQAVAEGSRKYWALKRERTDLQNLIPQLESGIRDAINKNLPLIEQLGRAGAEIFGKTIERRIDTALQETNLRIQQVQNASQRAALAQLPRQTEESIDERVRLEKEGIKIESKLRQVQENLINSIDLLRVEMEIRRLREERANIRQEYAGDGRVRNAMLDVNQAAIDRAENTQKALKAKDLPTLRKLATEDPSLLNAIYRITNRTVEQATVDSKLAEAEFRGDLDKIAARTEQERKALEAKLADIGKAVPAAFESGIAREQFLDKQAKELQGVQQQIRELENRALTERNEAARKAGASGLAVESVNRILQQEKDRAETSAAIADNAENQKNQIALQVAFLDEAINKLKEEQTTSKALADSTFKDREAAIAMQRTQLGLDQENYRVSIDQVAQRQYAIEVADAQLDRDRKQYDIRQKLALDEIEWAKKYAAQGYIMSDLLRAELLGLRERGALAQSEADKEFERRKNLAQITKDQMDQQATMAKQIGGVFEGVTDKMTDAFMKFAETGKLSFKDLANSVIADIARIIIRMQILNMMESMFGKGFAGAGGNWFSKIFTTAASSAAGGFVPSGGEGSMYVLSSEMPKRAKGAAYMDTGVEMYAKGGMFTNKIVAEPTMFKFAKGVGMMGEAGPEAIMPLRRDGDGNLGVIAQPQQQGKVEVVVNNFSGEKAETRETVDSRGNRKIEVVVGEMVASEMGRKNSPLQQSMMNNFVTRPATVRR
jgi:hypothetical protein